MPQVRVGDQFGEVLAAAQSGGEWAMAVLYRSLQPAVLRFLGARAPQDAEDLASQTWIDVARALPRFSGDEDAFRALVLTVARRRLVDHLRSRQRRPVDLPGDRVLERVSGDDRPEEATLAALSGDEAARRIAEILPTDQAEIVLLRVLGGFTADEVAAVVGRRPGTVRVMQHRALRRLAKALGQ